MAISFIADNPADGVVAVWTGDSLPVISLCPAFIDSASVFEDWARVITSETSNAEGTASEFVGVSVTDVSVEPVVCG